MEVHSPSLRSITKPGPDQTRRRPISRWRAEVLPAREQAPVPHVLARAQISEQQSAVTARSSQASAYDVELGTLGTRQDGPMVM
jgi:hypothetical protein